MSKLIDTKMGGQVIGTYAEVVKNDTLTEKETGEVKRLVHTKWYGGNKYFVQPLGTAFDGLKTGQRILVHQLANTGSNGIRGDGDYVLISIDGKEVA